MNKGKDVSVVGWMDSSLVDGSGEEVMVDELKFIFDTYYFI